MGMFDYINYECDCPNCGNKVTGFQSKDDRCQLATLEPEQVTNFYGDCRECGAWLEFDVNVVPQSVILIARPVTRKIGGGKL